MLTPAWPIDERERQGALDQLCLTHLEIEEAFERVARLVTQLLDVPISIFTILDRDWAFSKAASGSDFREGPRNLSFCAHTVLHNDVFVVSDTRADDIFHDHPYVTGSPFIVFYASVPVRAPNGQPIGALCAIDTRPRVFTPAMESVLVALAAVLDDELRFRQLSTVDHLTGLFNRRQFDDQIDREWHRALRMGLPLSLLAIDVDHFKSYNDHYGHPAGDDCLRAISEAIREECSRSGDQAFRIGGEEFAVVLPATDEEGAALIAQRLSAAIRALALPHEVAPNGIVTLCIGVVAAVNPANHELRDLVKSADSALYAAKAGGRDAVVVRQLQVEP